VAEHILTRMVNAEPRITVLCDFFIADAERDAREACLLEDADGTFGADQHGKRPQQSTPGCRLKTATFRHMREKQSVTVSGKACGVRSAAANRQALRKGPLPPPMPRERAAEKSIVSPA